MNDCKIENKELELDAMNTYIKAIYRILEALEKSLDTEKPLFELFTPEKLKISKTRWLNYLLMLENAGYVDGVKVTEFCGGDVNIDIENIKITLKGLEYLATNTAMTRAYNAFKNVKNIIT